MMERGNFCPCCSEKSYDECCKPYHQGAQPENAVQLMRSRFSAYVLNLPDYIIATTHPACPQYSLNKFSWKRSISQFSQHSSFKKLEVLDHKENKNLATVTFTVFLFQDGRDSTFTEKSYFEKMGTRWLYRRGEFAKGVDRSLVTEKPLRLLQLAYYNDPILRKKASPITEITSEIRNLVEEMIETMDAFDGIGLAAPQIFHSIRLFIIRTPIEDQDELGDVKVFINPILTLPSKETWKSAEACMSIPLISGTVERPKEITVEYTSLDGELKKTRFSGLEARVIMHENDHINGILYIDRVEKKERQKLSPLLLSIEDLFKP